MLIEILAVIGLDSDSTLALENLRKASDLLRERYGIRLIIIPYNTWSDNLNASLRSLPTIFIGGVKAFSGRVPSVEEIVNFVLRYANNKRDKKLQDSLIPAALIVGDPSILSSAIV